MTSATSISPANTILPVLPVVVPEGEDPKTFAVGTEAYTGPGKLANSRFLDGMDVETAKNEVATPAGKGRPRVTHGELPPARLAGLAPASLGLPDPHGALRGLRPGAGQARRPAGASCPMS